MYSIAYSYNRLGKYTHGGIKDVKRRSKGCAPLLFFFTCSLKIRTKDLVIKYV